MRRRSGSAEAGVASLAPSFRRRRAASGGWGARRLPRPRRASKCAHGCPQPRRRRGSAKPAGRRRASTAAFPADEPPPPSPRQLGHKRRGRPKGVKDTRPRKSRAAADAASASAGGGGGPPASGAPPPSPPRYDASAAARFLAAAAPPPPLVGVADLAAPLPLLRGLPPFLAPPAAPAAGEASQLAALQRGGRLWF